MSFNFINNFQVQLHQLLAREEFINQTVNNIYLSVTQDAKYPFILINILKAEDVSRFHYNIYNIDFEICVFARDKNQKILTLLADKIINTIKIDLNSSIEYEILGIESAEIIFNKSQDLITTKLSIPYKATLFKEKESYEFS